MTVLDFDKDLLHYNFSVDGQVLNYSIVLTVSFDNRWDY